jgi:hypothetical protein
MDQHVYVRSPQFQVRLYLRTVHDVGFVSGTEPERQDNEVEEPDRRPNDVYLGLSLNEFSDVMGNIG